MTVFLATDQRRNSDLWTNRATRLRLKDTNKKTWIAFSFYYTMYSIFELKKYTEALRFLTASVNLNRLGPLRHFGRWIKESYLCVIKVNLILMNDKNMHKHISTRQKILYWSRIHDIQWNSRLRSSGDHILISACGQGHILAKRCFWWSRGETRAPGGAQIKKKINMITCINTEKPLVNLVSALYQADRS